MSSTEQAQQTDHQPQSSPETPEQPPSANDLPTTSHVLKNAPQHLKPTEAVACMNCPLAVWMLKGKTLECYCRTLYLVTWETNKPGTITMCDAPAQALEAAQKSSETPTRTPQLSQTQPLAFPPMYNEESQSFGLLDLGNALTTQ